MVITPVARSAGNADVFGERQRLADRRPDGCGIGAHAIDPFARLAGARRGDPAHGGDHRRKLPHRADARDDVAELLCHDVAAGRASVLTASTSFARPGAVAGSRCHHCGDDVGRQRVELRSDAGARLRDPGDRRGVEHALRQGREQRDLVDEAKRGETRLGESARMRSPRAICRA